jgi:hypothetical protein
LSDHSEHKGDHHIPFESEAAIIHGAANEEERQKAEEQEREKEYKRRDDAFKERQVAIAERQLTENSRISKFTLALVIVSLLGSSVALYQAYVSGISSRAALSAAENAESTLIEQRRLREQSASESQYAREASAAETDAADQRNMAALKASAEQSRQALDTSIKAMQLTLRPYLVAGALRLAGEFTGDKNFVGHIGVINAGHTPATHVDGCSDLIFRPQSRPITDDEPCPSPENPPAINHTQPTGEHSISVIGPNLPPFDMVSPGSMVRFLNLHS